MTRPEEGTYVPADDEMIDEVYSEGDGRGIGAGTILIGLGALAAVGGAIWYFTR